MKILCFGSELIEEDKLALDIADELKIKGIEFVKCTHPDDILKYKKEKQIIILDVAKGIKEIKTIEDIDKLKDKNILSPHDFDLSEMLKLIKELYGTKTKIIALPYGMEKEKGIEEIKRILNK